ncbi:50S ribosomal protein P1 [Candidatus Marsarchaeota G2 archaeon ECH_B_SAG-F08]|jgi:LSU ribosomal protein L12AE|uniref:Large ribosomal subunit protein P1 n=4 Tax=Candidatus Marsarchaeota TaxID=1978152 RepID=A0A2R6BF75_9ARCH|nr:MAG: 50S ribosomal protein P1 [Candidatus Marsarchaeota G1 archaeon OSP_D]PSN89647.1 MAG: 50S ribosomal protein P1 [Candidatus Marsarchaeota G1 archaeon OSP_C]PSN91607.1 MAG: 50S ribosomal protein P1 [Candidatus Marsarchaeota G1 archaeon OSP_B]PSN97300.1 MAG: 50S ribosomal protein P1 [Candidatus Marsarchaeota G2 archaeon ECH_B_SAG-F08]
MLYVYASLLLHSAGKEINEENLKRVIEATGVEADLVQIKAIVAALKNVNIDEVIKKGVSLAAPVAPTAQPQPQPQQVEATKPKEEKKEEEEEVSAEGLSALFG